MISLAHQDISSSVRKRLSLFVSSGNPRVILDRQAAEEVALLRASIGWPPLGQPPAHAALRRDLDVISLAGMVQFIRCQQLPLVDRIDAWLEATELFTVVYPIAPDAVPEQLRDMCVALAGNPPQVHHAELHNEAIDMLDAAEVSRDRAEVDHAIWLLMSAFLAAPADDDRARHLSVVGTGWLGRFWITGRAADLDNAVAAHRRALALGVSDAADQAGHLANFSAALLARFEANGSVPDLDEAVAAARGAAELATTVSEQRRPGWSHEAGQHRAPALAHALHTSQSGLASALLRRYLYGGVPADLDNAITAGRAAVDAAPEGDPGRPGLQANLANLLLERFTRQWKLTDLTEAVTTARTAVDAATSQNPARAVALSALSLAHADHFAYSGHLRDLDLAISVGEQAVAAAPDGHPGAASCLSNLGGILRTRYQRTGDTLALDEAVMVLRKAVHVAPADHVSRPGYLNNLGCALRSRFDASSAAAAPATDPDDIRESITALTEAVAAAHRGGPDRVGYVANLASSLILAAEHNAYPGALEEAISTLDREVGTISVDHPLRYVYLVSLGSAWLARYDASDDNQALEVAIGYLGQAAEAIPGEHPHRAEYLGRLGSALRRKFERSPDHATAQAAMAASKSAAGISTAPAMVRVLAARDWGQVAARAGQTAEAVDGHCAAVNLLDRVAWQGLQRRDQERNLGQFAALACDAAAWAIQAGQPERAVQLLEQGRGVLLAQSLDQRARHHDLRHAAPDLADELARIDDALEHLPSADDPLRETGSILARHLVGERDTLLQQIRSLPGFTDFLTPPAFATLREAAAAGPVVIINVSGYRCDALTVTAEEVQVTPLTGLTGADVVTNVAAFLQAVGQPDRRTVIAGILAWLWDTVVAPLVPVLTEVCPAATGQRPRIWWCPTGPLTFVPLHAAGRHDGTGHSVLDQFTSSYTPTLRLLLRGRADASQVSRSDPPLIVALPETQGQRPLPGAAVEADDFIRQFSPASQLRGADATVEAVRRLLRRGPALAHFACHGVQDLTDPSAGHLVLHDGPLSITEIAGLRLDAAELAYLSACQTSTGGIQLSDESITLATAFRLAGYRHVIGTLWSISDRHAPDVARKVYQQLKQSETGGIEVGGAAGALDHAVVALRKRRPTQPWLWASYIHVGP